MGGTDPSSPRRGRARGLESVVRLYLSRPSRRAVEETTKLDPAEQARTGAQRAGRSLADEFGFEPDEYREQEEAARGAAAAPGAVADELPPLEPDDEGPSPGEEHLPPLRLGEEARHAEAAFQIEESLLENAPGETPGSVEGGAAAAGPPPAEQPVQEPTESQEMDALVDREVEIEIEFEENWQGSAVLPAQGAGRIDPTFASLADEMFEIESAELEPAPEVERVGPSSAETADELLEMESAELAPAPEVAARTAPAYGESHPRVILAVGAASHPIRGLLLDSLCAPVASEGRRVMLLETEPRQDLTSELFEESFGLDTPVFRRGFGKSTREVLLLPPEERRAIFDRIAADESLADLVVIDLELPESILCLRLQFLVDAIVIALTTRESSLYEAYRALRGLSDRRPDMAPFVVPIARSEEEAQVLFDRFRGIANDFLKIPVREGGWVALPARTSLANERGSILSEMASSPAALSAPLAGLLRGTDPIPSSERTALREADRAFFEQLGDWFGPAML